MSGSKAERLSAVVIGAILLFVIGCTPGSSGSSDDPPASVGGSTLASDPPGGSVGDPGGGDPVNDPAPASVPEPATGLLFLCAAGSATLARLRARKRA